MINDKKYDLLLDIAKLVKTYGFEIFFDLSKDLSSPLFKDRLAEILLKTGETAKEIGVNKPKKKIASASKRSFRSQILSLSESQPKKSKLLIKLYDDLSAKRSLPTLRDIKNFIIDNGLQPLNAKSRKNAIIPFVKQFLDLEESDIEKMIYNVLLAVENDDRSLAGWSDIILKKKSNHTKE